MSIQIPNLHTSNKTAVKVSAQVFIQRRKTGSLTGVFGVKGALAFDPATDTYPAGSLTITTDRPVQGGHWRQGAGLPLLDHVR